MIGTDNHYLWFLILVSGYTCAKISKESYTYTKNFNFFRCPAENFVVSGSLPPLFRKM